MITFKTYILLDSFETNTYLVWDDTSLEAILIDPAAPNETLRKEIISMNLKLTHIINTHGHGDHIGGNEYFQTAFNCPIAIHPNDAPMLTKSSLNLSDFMNNPFTSPAATISLSDQHEIPLGQHKITIYHTPGHTQGGIVIYAKPYLFSGDTIFLMDVGRTDLPGGDFNQLVNSIKNKVFILPDETVILPGHGPASSVGKEKVHNQYLQEKYT